MTTIKIFLASSKELESERDKFASLINQLNRIFKRRGLKLELVIWEYLDSSMSKKRKQDEYNEELRQCEICLVVFWNVFGEDVEWAVWLQHELEHYRLPASYKGRMDVRQELQSIFLDIDELSSGNLLMQIQQSLQDSQNLIVICSPQAAKSPWVNQWL